jgi:hypothetical protein
MMAPEDTADDYESLRRLLDNRRRELRLTMLDVDYRAGWADGYASKAFCGTRNFGLRSLGLILQVLRVRIMLVPIDKKP